MIFSELYSAYYNTVARIITAAFDKNTTEKDLDRIVSENAFSESVLTIMPSLKSGKWRLLRPPGAESAGTGLRGRQCAGTSGAAAAGGAPPSVGGKAQRRKGQIRLGPGAVPGRAAVGAAFHRGRL